MSLINDLLRDLDARGVATTVSGVQTPPRTVPARRRWQGQWIWAAPLITITALALGYALGPWSRSAPASLPLQSSSLPVAAAVGDVDVAAQATLAIAGTDELPAAAAADSEPASPSQGSTPPELTPEADAPSPSKASATPVAQVQPMQATSATDEHAPTPDALPAAIASPASKPDRAVPIAATPQPTAMQAAAVEAQPEPVAPAPARSQLRIVQADSDATRDLERQLHAAAAALNVGREDEAEAALLLALREQPQAQRARKALVALYQRQGRTDLAIASLRQGLQLDPGATALADSLARLLLQGGDPAAAATSLAGALPAIAAAPDQHALLAYALAQAGKPRQAASVYRQLIEHDPSRGAWWMGLGLAEAEQGRHSQALQAFQRARASHGLDHSVLRFLDQRIHSLEAAAP